MKLISVRLLNQDHAIQTHFDAEKQIYVEIVYELFVTVRGMRLVLQVLNAEGIVVFSSTDHALREPESTPGIYQTLCIIPDCLLNTGCYSLSVHAGCPGIKVLVHGQEFLEFFIERISHHGSLFREKWPGIVAPGLTWKTVALLQGK